MYETCVFLVTLLLPNRADDATARSVESKSTFLAANPSILQ